MQKPEFREIVSRAPADDAAKGARRLLVVLVRQVKYFLFENGLVRRCCRFDERRMQSGAQNV